jgi:hypothetical protein
MAPVISARSPAMLTASIGRNGKARRYATSARPCKATSPSTHSAQWHLCSGLPSALPQPSLGGSLFRRDRKSEAVGDARRGTARGPETDGGAVSGWKYPGQQRDARRSPPRHQWDRDLEMQILERSAIEDAVTSLDRECRSCLRPRGLLRFPCHRASASPPCGEGHRVDRTLVLLSTRVERPLERRPC